MRNREGPVAAYPRAAAGAAARITGLQSKSECDGRAHQPRRRLETEPSPPHQAASVGLLSALTARSVARQWKAQARALFSGGRKGGRGEAERGRPGGGWAPLGGLAQVQRWRWRPVGGRLPTSRGPPLPGSVLELEAAPRPQREAPRGSGRRRLLQVPGGPVRSVSEALVTPTRGSGSGQAGPARSWGASSSQAPGKRRVRCRTCTAERPGRGPPQQLGAGGRQLPPGVGTPVRTEPWGREAEARGAAPRPGRLPRAPASGSPVSCHWLRPHCPREAAWAWARL